MTPTKPRFTFREKGSNNWLRRLFNNLRCQMTWLDFGVGLAGAVTLTALLFGFRYQLFPEYKVGDVATQDVRPSQDVIYQDFGAAEKQREAARSAIPAYYDLDMQRIRSRQAEVSSAFETARKILAEKQVSVPGRLTAEQIEELGRVVDEKVGGLFPPEALPVLLKHQFNQSLEVQILRVLDSILRGGIVANREQFVKDQATGIVIRDSSTLVEQPMTAAFVARDVEGARENLRQFRLEFPQLAAGDRNAIVSLLQHLLVPTLILNEKETDLRREAATARVLPAEVHIKQGQTIVRAGDKITPSVLSQLEALQNLYRPKSLVGQFLGYLFFVSTFLYAVWRYLVLYQKRHRKIRNHTLLILLILVGGLAVSRLLTSFADILSERVSIDAFRDPSALYYGIPFAFGAVLVALLVDVNLGVFVSMSLAGLMGMFYGDVYLATYVLTGSLAGIYSIRQYKDRAAILKAGLTIATVNWLAILAIDALRQVGLTASVLYFSAIVALTSGILASALASMLLPALESLFKITTDIRLLELSNLNAPILRRLSVEAPGTYHHSLMVGTLAEAAAEAIGANPLIVRVGAYYHDLGKMLKPEYFVENQIFGINKHETLSPSMSCLIIASHVKDGLELAKEIGLAERIRDLIPQHHGTRIMTYFYQKAKELQEAKNQEIVETDFRYPGPKPQTKEAAIMMMADSVEAASRTLSNPSSAQIQGMINRVVDAIVADNQFDECDITMRDIQLVKESFFKILTGIYHRRIDYPGFDFKETGSDAAQKPALQSTGAQ